MKNILNTTLLFSLIFSITACEKVIQLDVEQAAPVYIFEGLITNQFKQHYIKIGKSLTFYEAGENGKVSKAIVEVSDNEGNTWLFKEKESGLYLSEKEFAGKVGTTYTMKVEVDGKSFTAEDHLYYVEPIDTLVAFIDEEEQADPEVEGEFWDFFTFLIEPQETEDYYLAQFFRNGERLDFDGEDIYVFNDFGISEEINGVTSPSYFAAGDTARVEWYSLSRQAYLFYTSLSENLNSDGGVFSGQPSNAQTNISNGALGLFQTSAVDIREVVME